MPKLGQLLVQRGWSSPQDIRSALVAQRTVGNRLGTCLVENNVLDEDLLHQALSLQHRVPAVEPNTLREADPQAVGLVLAKVASRCKAVPFDATATRLRVAMEDPRDLELQDELAFASGKRLEVFVASEVRIAEALERHYDEPAPSRLASLAERLNRARYLWRDGGSGSDRRSGAATRAQGNGGGFLGTDPASAGRVDDALGLAPEGRAPARTDGASSSGASSSGASSSGASASSGTEEWETEDLTFDDPLPDTPDELFDSQGTHRQRSTPSTAGESPAPESETSPPASPRTSREAPAPSASPEPTPPPPATSSAASSAPSSAAPSSSNRSTSSSSAPAPPESTAPPARRRRRPPARVITLSAAERRELEGTDEPARDARPEPSAPGAPSLAATEARLEAAGSTDDLGDALIEHLGARFERAILLRLRQGRLVGWRGAGDGVDRNRLASLALDLEEPSLFVNLREGGSFYRGPLQPMGPHRELAACWGGSLPEDSLLVPVRLGDRLALVIYVDRGTEGFGDVVRTPELGVLLRLASTATRSLGDLLQRRVFEGGSRQGRSSGRISKQNKE